MIIISLLIFGIVLLYVCTSTTLLQDKIGWDKHDGVAFWTAMSVVMIALTTISTIISTGSHLYDKGTIIGAHHVITVHEERIINLQEHFNTLTTFGHPVNNIFLSANADSPLTQVVKSISEAEKELLRTKERQAYARQNIIRRKIGLWWFVPVLFDWNDSVDYQL